MYTVALSAGVSGGIIIAGLVTITHSWRYIYYIATALIGALTILVVLTLPETSFVRSPDGQSNSIEPKTVEKVTQELRVELAEHGIAEHAAAAKHEQAVNKSSNQSKPEPSKKGLLSSLSLFSGTYTDESLWKMTYRPVILLALPTVLWATLVMSVTIGFLVAISSNFASAFQATYGFKSWQSGLCFISGLIGTMFGILGGGWFSDWVADFFTRRNNGIREPEMRLPAMTLALISSPLALVLYGCGIEYQWHWIVPTFSLGLCRSLSPLPDELLLTDDDSELRNCAGDKRIAGVHHRLISTNCWRNNCDAACL